jgi:anion-transporting  ArsA/GET3 family ATPase
MNKTKVLGFAVIALLVLNFGILSFLFFSKNEDGPRGRKMPREIIIEKLHFDENQIVEYDKTIKIHQENIRNLDDSIKSAKNELYQLLNSDTIDSVKKDSLFLKLADLQKQIETTHFNHFIEIKKLCKKEQLPDYKNLTEELSKLFSHPRRPKH